MDIGGRLRQARLEKGFSQRQLCGELITRNMLSQIENGSAKPSMEVLCTLAARLEKPVSFFLEEDVVVSSNQTVMEQARRNFGQGALEETLVCLEDYRQPDGVFDGEWGLLGVLCCLALAERALDEERRPYALQLLERCAHYGEKTPYYSAPLRRQRQLLLGRLDEKEELPNVDEELMLLAWRAVASDPARGAALLQAVQDQTGPQWNYLRGLAAFGLGQYREAAVCLHRAEKDYPAETARKLEICYRELEDYKMAYFYATKNNGTG